MRHLRFLIITTLITIALIAFLDIIPYDYNLLLNTGSMEPTYTGGDVVLIKENYSEISKGDVIVFTARQGNVMHRVIRVNDLGYITQGDNLPDPDPGIRTDNTVNGVVIAHLQGCWLTEIIGNIDNKEKEELLEFMNRGQAIDIMFFVSSPADGVYERYPELEREDITISEVFEVVGEGEQKDKIRFE